MPQVLEDGRLREARPGEIAVQAPERPPRWRVRKSTFIDRMNDLEQVDYELFVTLLPRRQRLFLGAVTFFWNDDPQLAAAGAALGWSPQRIAQLLDIDPDPPA
jgi:hypothetical protein